MESANNPFQEIFLSKTFEADFWTELSKTAFSGDKNVFATVCVQELYRRNDSKFKTHLLSFVRSQSAADAEFSQLVFTKIYKLLSLLNRNLSNVNYSRQAVPLLRLICHVQWSTLDGNNKKLFVESILLASSVVAKTNTPKLHYKCFEVLNKWIVRSNNGSEFVDILKQFTQEDLAIASCVVWNFIAAIDSSLFTANKALILDLLCKNVIMSKKNVSSIVQSYCFKNLVKSITSDDFKSSIFPTIQKAVLRNSEIALGLMPLLFSNLNIKLTDYHQDLAKIIGTNIKIENLQVETLKTVEAVAPLLDSDSSVESILQYLTNVYNGKEGKLTSAGQKIGVLKAMAGLADNSVSNKSKIFNFATNCFFSTIKLETLESNVQFCFAQMNVWFEKCPAVEVDDTFWKNVKEFRKFKLSAQTMGNFLACIVSYLQTAQSKKIDDDLVTFVAASSKNVSLPVTKIVQLNECINACVILLQLGAQEKLLPSLKALDKVTFLTEKFIEDSPAENLNNLCHFIELICDVTGFSSKIEIRRILLALMSNQNREIRENANRIYKQFFSKNSSFVVDMFDLFETMFQQSTSSNAGILRCFHVLTDFSELPADTDVEDILWKSFKICHIDAVYNSKPDVFFTIAKRALEGKRLQVFYENYVPKIIALIFNSEINSNTRINIVRANSSLSWSKFLPELMETLKQSIETITGELLKIDDFDFAVYRMPPGELFNKEAVISAGISGDKNQKRENKLYSYKEQLADLEFQKEQEAKIRASFDVSKLNKKQQEVYQQEVTKEKQIQERLEQFIGPFQFALDVLYALFESNPILTSIQFKDIHFVFIKLLKSVACKEDVIKFLHSISLKMMSEGDMDFINFVFLLTQTIVNIHVEESSDEIDSLVDRLVDYLYLRTCPNTSDEYDEKANRLAELNRLTTPGFTFALPVIQYAMKNYRKQDSTDWAEKCLNIVTQHHLIRSASFDLGVPFDAKNPQDLPASAVFDMLIQFSENENQPQLEEMACETLTAVGDSMNGGENSGRADDVFFGKLLDGLFHQKDSIRETCSSILMDFDDSIFTNTDLGELCKRKMHQRIFVASFDNLKTVVLPAQDILSRCINFNECKEEMLQDIVEQDINNANASVVKPISLAIEAIIKENNTSLSNIVGRLQEIYGVKAKQAIPKLDKFGRALDREHFDRFEGRLAIATTFTRLVQFFNQEQVEKTVQFLIPGALGDHNEDVRATMLEVGIQIIDFHGSHNIAYLLEVFEKFLDTADDTSEADIVRKSVIVLMGTLAAKHIKESDPKLKPILGVLCDALNTPSQMVQEAVATCLTQLTPKFAQDSDTFIAKLLNFLFEAETYGQRKGAAYGISGIVKGLGVLSLHKFGIMKTLMETINSKASGPHKREGVLFAFEMLSRMLGQIFEPYVVDILPSLLDCFADGNLRVRQAADDASKVIMSKLTARGVTIVYPAILIALDDDNWRKRVSSIELLASMAYCAPRQLSTCLPKIVPKLMHVINDTHPKVEKSAAEALKTIGSVIKNPEIQKIVPTLMDSLQDPANKTNTSLNVMLNMKFVHLVDPPSLALIMPVVERAFQNRSSETRKMAAQIIGNMNSLTKKKDLSPYLPAIIPGLKNSLLDPVPEVRGVTARALGAMVKCLGEEVLSELMPWLKAMLVSEASSVDRSGAAQGLSEVLGGLGLESLHKIVPEIIAITERSDVVPHVKDGYLMMFIYLPLVFTQHFANYIGQVINPILQSLADETEFVRDTALRAGQRITNMYAETAIQLLLPELEAGLFDENWRIRYSSVQLLGDLLFKILGVSGKMTTESGHEDDNFGTETSTQAILSSLGLERRNHILSGLYMARSDVSLQVRQASIHVWKVVVPNTPRLLREILPTLFSILLSSLASNRAENQQIAARALGDLVRKLGERILPEIIPILENGLESDKSDQRQGVCIGLSEIISSTSKEMVQAFADSLVPTVEKALFDPLPDVRLAAAQTFDNLYAAVGTKALDEVLPTCIENLDKPEMNERTLDTLKNIIQFRSRIVLPYLIPKLTASPVNTRALSLISSVAGDALSKYLPKIIPALLSALSESVDTKNYAKCLENAKSVVLSVSDDAGSTELVVSLIEHINEGDENTRRASITLLVAYCVQAKPYLLENFQSQLWRGLIQFLASDDEFIINEATQALAVLQKNMDSADQLEMLPEVSNYLRYSISDCVEKCTDKENVVLPGFRSNKGFLPLYNIFKEGLLSTNLDNKIFAIGGLRDIVKYSSSEALKPSIMVMSGTLLRIVTTINAEDVKILLAEVIGEILKKCGLALRIFHPQIQSFLFRSLGDSNRAFRLEVARSLAALSTVHNKLDAFVAEMLGLLAKLPYDQLKYHETGYYGLRLIVEASGDQFSPETITLIVRQVPEMEVLQQEDCIRATAASVIGALLVHLKDGPQMDNLMKDYVMYDKVEEEWTVRHFRSVVIRVALRQAFDRVMERTEWVDRIHSNILGYICSKKEELAVSGIHAAAFLFDSSFQRGVHPLQSIVLAYAKAMNGTMNDVKVAIGESSVWWANRHATFDKFIIKHIVPMLVNGTKERNSAVRTNSEHALVAFLKLKEPDSAMLKKTEKVLDVGAFESLEDALVKVKKIINKVEFKDEHFDRTLLS